ncbi:hypothetical protein Tco_1407014 [Tanacetum coccineum]
MSGEEPATQIAPVESPQMVSTVKLPILKKGEYTLWSMRMEQYLTNTDYSLWQVILNGDGPIQVTTDENGVETEVPPKTAQALLQRQRERKAKSILLLAIPDEYQLRFHGIKDAKSLWAAIKSRFGGNVRMRAEYNIREKRRLKSVAKDRVELLKVREKEVEDLKVQLLLKEAEAAEAIRLRAEASKFEAVKKSLQDEVKALNERNASLEKERDALDVNVTGLEASAIGKDRELTNLNAQLTSIKSHNDSLVDHVHELEDAQLKIVNDKFDKLYADFVEMALHLEEKFYLHLLTTISGRRWLLTHGMKLAIIKCLNSLEYLSALRAAIGKAIEKGMQDGLAELSLFFMVLQLSKIFRDAQKANLEIVAYQLGLESIEAQLVIHSEKNDVFSKEKITEMLRVESIRPSGVIIEDWVSNDEDIFQSNNLQATDKPSFKRIEFTNARNESVKPKQAEKPRINTQNPKLYHRVNGVNTAGQTAVSAVKGNRVTAVKASAGNKDFLIDYQDIDGGFVAFGGSARGGKIKERKDKDQIS